MGATKAAPFADKVTFALLLMGTIMTIGALLLLS